MTKTHWIVAAIAAALMYLLGFLTGKAVYDRPIEEKVERDTVIVTDTVTHYLPTPKDSIRTKSVTRFLPIVRTDTVTQSEVEWLHDTVAVEVPIISKHYGCEQYDAWVSGFEPSLDSIKVYQQTQIITEVRTISKPPNRWELNAVAGIKYNTTNKEYTPSAGIELLYKPNRMSLGIQGGIEKNDKVEPVIKGVMKIRIM